MTRHNAPPPKRDLASLIAAAYQLVGVPLSFNAALGTICSAPDALTETEAFTALGALEHAEIKRAKISANSPTFERAVELLAAGHLDARRFAARLFERSEDEVHSAMREVASRRS